MQVVGPDGNLTDVYIRLVGVDSAKWREIKLDIERKAMSGDSGSLSPAEYLADATLGWRGIESNGNPLEFSPDAAINLYTDAPYICDQADRFVAKRLNFMTASLPE